MKNKKTEEKYTNDPHELRYSITRLINSLCLPSPNNIMEDTSKLIEEYLYCLTHVIARDIAYATKIVLVNQQKYFDKSTKYFIFEMADKRPLRIDISSEKEIEIRGEIEVPDNNNNSVVKYHHRKVYEIFDELNHGNAPLYLDYNYILHMINKKARNTFNLDNISVFVENGKLCYKVSTVISKEVYNALIENNNEEKE